MKHSSAESRDDMFGQSESELETKLSSAHETPLIEAEQELDEEDEHDLLMESWILLGDVIELRMRSQLKRDLIRLRQRYEDALSWYNLQ